MLIYGFLLVLLLRPNWGLLGFFTLVATALPVVFGLRGGLDLETIVVYGVTQGAIFGVLGTIIVFLRLKFGKGKSKQDGEIDAELARMRAESARDGSPAQHD